MLIIDQPMVWGGVDAMTREAAKAVFLDRDGVIVKDSGFVSSPDQVRLLPNAAHAIKLLHQKGYLVIIVSNQSGVGRGYFSEADLARVDMEVKKRLSVNGAHIDDTYYCPHHPQAAVEAYRQDCSCRKPQPGMIIEAQKKHKIDLSLSFMVGDAIRDVESGKKAGCQTILIAKKSRRAKSFEASTSAGTVAATLFEAVEKYIR